MTRKLKVSIGQWSDRGIKEDNQDFHGAIVPDEPALTHKGIAVAIADGISSSRVSRVAAESAVKSFLSDYYCTSDAWSVKTSAQRVISAVNSWLHAQNRRSEHAYDPDRGYVCAFSALVLKGATAHLFHVGDARISRLSGRSLEQLTEDHRVVASSEQTYLGRALGVDRHIEIDYCGIAIAPSEIYLLTTDGVHEHVGGPAIAQSIAAKAPDLDAAARDIVAQAMANGSRDNLTIQIVRVDATGDGDAADVLGRTADLPPPPLLQARQVLDGYRIERPLHSSSRSHVYLATDIESGARVALKIPSLDLRGEPAYLRRFMMEEWVARRIDNAHVLKAAPTDRSRSHLYTVAEFVEGQSLEQWMRDNPAPDLDQARDIIEQIAKGLRAFHRKEMLHQDLRPANVMIDRSGTVKIIDFGSVRVAGVLEAAPEIDGADVLGAAQYTAPEYYLGLGGSTRSDLFSLGVIAYQMLTGHLPYGARVAASRTRAQQRRLVYASACDDRRNIPDWVDWALEKAVAIDPLKRHEALSEFLHDLRHPNPRCRAPRSRPLLERNPTLFWKVAALLLALTSLLQLISQFRGRQ